MSGLPPVISLKSNSELQTQTECKGGINGMIMINVLHTREEDNERCTDFRHVIQPSKYPPSEGTSSDNELW